MNFTQNFFLGFYTQMAPEKLYLGKVMITHANIR